MRVGILTGAVLLAACGTRHLDDGGDGGLGELCPETCSIDLHAVVDCHGAVVRECPDDTGCGADQKCMPACDAARSVFWCGRSESRSTEGALRLKTAP